MNIPMNLLLWGAAFLPILFLLVTIMKFGWSIAKASLIGMLLALIIAIVLYYSSVESIVYEGVKGLWNALGILLVIWPAVFSYELTDKIGGFIAIKVGIQKITRHELLQILILGWVFPSFLQGITGFGVAVAVGAPLLVSIGVKPLWSIIIVLLSHSWGATFGTLALAWDALLIQAGIIDSTEIVMTALIAATMIWCFNAIGVAISCWFYGKGKALKEIAPIYMGLSFIMGCGQLILAPINSTISNFLPSALALGIVFVICRTKRYQKNWSLEDSPIMDRKEIEEKIVLKMSYNQAFLPYYILTFITVICLLMPPINRALSQWKLGLKFPETSTGYGLVTAAESLFAPLTPLTHAGTFLTLSTIVSYFYYYKTKTIKKSDLKCVWRRTFQKCMPSTMAITCLNIMSRFMSSSGQIYILSQGIVNIFGEYYIIVAPIIGMLGTFITSSNMSSNILFGKFQMTVAELLQMKPSVTLALQTVGGVLGTSFSPGCIIMGISTTGLVGGENKILKIVIPIVGSCAIIFGMVAYLFLA